MAISFTKYINITSGVGGAAQVAARELIARMFSENPLIPTGGVLEFTTLEDVGSYFGTTSAEYDRAVPYFGFISKNITKADKISYAFWPSAATPARIYGDRDAKALSDFTSIADGEFSLTLGAITATVSACDFTASASLADVALVLQTQVNAADADPSFASATVSYEATRGSFNLVSGSTGAAVVSTAVSGGGTDILSLIGWVDSGLQAADSAIFSDGADAETVTDTLDSSANASDNFGSYLFIPALTDDEIEESAVWNAGQNVKFMFMIRTLEADAAAQFTALGDYGGSGATISETGGEYPEVLPMAVLAATKYQRRNSTVNYMFQQLDGLTASVTDTDLSNALDAIRTNYYGETQKAGQPIRFYQKGVLYGSSEDPIAMNVYANEIWLKDAAGTELMNLLLAIKVSANKTGRALVNNSLQTVIDSGLFNGTISVGKPLTTTQKSFITQVSGSDKAWYQVQNLGYWFEVVFEQFVNTSSENEFKAVYTLIYSKDDAIRRVDGTHILI